MNESEALIIPGMIESNEIKLLFNSASKIVLNDNDQISSKNNKIVVKLNEKPYIKRIVNAGIYICKPSTVGLIKDDESLPMTEVINRALNRKMVIKHFPLEDWIDIGNQSNLNLARGQY